MVDEEFACQVCNSCDSSLVATPAFRLTCSTVSLTSALNKYLGQGVYDRVCASCFNIVDKIEQFQVKLQDMIEQLVLMHKKTLRILEEKALEELKLKEAETKKALDKPSPIKCGDKRSPVKCSEKSVFKCQLCDKQFTRSNDLKAHIRMHRGEKPFQCDECGASFTQKQNLNSHKKLVHLQIRSYTCDLCEKKFGTNRQLNKHIQGKHYGVKQFECDQCQKTFSCGARARIHKEQTCKALKSKCLECGKMYSLTLPHSCVRKKTEKRGSQNVTESTDNNKAFVNFGSQTNKEQIGDVAKSFIQTVPVVLEVKPPVMENRMSTKSSIEISILKPATNTSNLVIVEKPPPPQWHVLGKGESVKSEAKVSGHGNLMEDALKPEFSGISLPGSVHPKTRLPEIRLVKPESPADTELETAVFSIINNKQPKL